MTSFTSILRFLAAIAFALPPVACAICSDHIPPNVLLITSEDHGPHLSCYGDPNVETPNLDGLANAESRVQQAYATWKNGPPVELYDLKHDPNEFNNLARQSEHAYVQDRLLKVLRDWQHRTSDGLADREKLRRYLNEVDQVVAEYDGRNARYRRDKNFRWRYLEYLKP